MKFTTRELVGMGVFGALWGGVEITLGSVFHTLNVPMTGMFLSAIGLMVAMVARFFIPRIGSTFFIGVIAALLKMFSLGGIVVWPMIAIVMEAVVAEIVLSIFRYPSRIAYLSTGVLGVIYTLVHPFFSQGILAGKGMIFAWQLLVERGLQLFSLSSSVAWLIIGLLVLIHFAVGAIAGYLAWDVGRRVRERMDHSMVQAV